MRGINETLETLNGPAAFRLAIDESATVIILDQTPKQLKRHKINGRAVGVCKGDGCKMCAAELDLYTDYLLRVYENVTDKDGVIEWRPRTLWLDKRQFIELGKALPDDKAGAILVAFGTAEKAKNGNTYCKIVWTLHVDQDISGLTLN